MLTDPDLALFLYIAVVVLGFLLSPRWGKVQAALKGTGTAVANKAASTGAMAK